MDKLPSGSSESTDKDQQYLGNKIGPRRFCDDVLLDTLHFLRRNEHAQVRLASRRLQWLSNTACARLPLRVVPWLEVRSVYASPVANGVPHAKAARPRMVGNSIRVYPASGSSHLADFPSVEPPENILRLRSMVIYDFVGPELLHFLRVSARLLGKCRMVFFDFDSFVRHNSTKFIDCFFSHIPSANRTIELHHVSSLAAPLFREHPEMFGCVKLTVECLDTSPLNALQDWLHLAEQQPPKQQIDRYLDIQFGYKVNTGHSVATVDHFVQQLKQRFLSATSCCPFTVRIVLIGGSYYTPRLLPFVENPRTGELLEFRRLEVHPGVYLLRRMRRETTAEQEEGGGEAETKKETVVYIQEVVQGDK